MVKRRFIMTSKDTPQIKQTLPAPELPEVQNGVVSLKDVPTAGLRFIVPEHSGIKVGDIVVARLGEAGDDFPWETKHTVDRPVSFTLHVPRTVLLDLTGKTAYAVYWVDKHPYPGSPSVAVEVTH
jgi:hypothetical protein